MGRMSELHIEMQEMEEAQQIERAQEELAEMRATTKDWWTEQDQEMDAEEERALELKAEIQEYRTQGYM